MDCNETYPRPVRTYRYVVASDTGFAPNPSAGFCTLACCKPGIRKTAEEGDWVFGFAGKRLRKKLGSPEQPRLIYAMEVGEKLKFGAFWDDERFPNHGDKKREDNIYKPLGTDRFEQQENKRHDETDHMKDVGGEFVLVGKSKNWWYFGKNAPSLKDLLGDDGEARERIKRLWHRGRGHSYNGLILGDTEALITALKRICKNSGRLGEPIDP